MLSCSRSHSLSHIVSVLWSHSLIVSWSLRLIVMVSVIHGHMTTVTWAHSYVSQSHGLTVYVTRYLILGVSVYRRLDVSWLVSTWSHSLLTSWSLCHIPSVSHGLKFHSLYVTCSHALSLMVSVLWSYGLMVSVSHSLCTSALRHSVSCSVTLWS